MNIEECEVSVFDTPGINSLTELGDLSLKDKMMYFEKLTGIVKHRNLMCIVYPINCLKASRAHKDPEILFDLFILRVWIYNF